MTTVLAIVPARKGSKGAPGKNRALIGGKPVIEYTIAALTAAKAVTSILITTDDSEIIDRYREQDDLFVVERPAHLATDESSTADAVSHALSAWELEAPTPDILLIAQPTTPLRRPEDIDGAFELLQKANAESVISACRVDGIRHPQVMYRLGDGNRGVAYLGDLSATRRQDFEPLYQRNGAIYFVRTSYFRGTRRLRSENPVIYEMPWERSINIDTPGDLLMAKAIIESGLLKP